jgi:hypothetical protein
MKKSLLKLSGIVVAICISTSSFAQTTGTLTFNFTEVSKANSATYQSQGKHVLAVWIQSNSGTFTKTRLRNAGGNTSDHLPVWAVNSGGSASNCLSTNCNKVGATTGASLSSFGAHNFTWDGTDATAVVGANVPDGVYKVTIEETWNHGTSGTAVRSFTFTKGPNSDVQTPTTDANFSNISLSWNPAASGVEENTVNTRVKIYPNPSADGIFIVEFAKANEISVIDAAGNTIFQSTVDANATSKAINLSQFSNGVYFINVVDGDRSSQQKVVLEK